MTTEFLRLGAMVRNFAKLEPADRNWLMSRFESDHRELLKQVSARKRYQAKLKAKKKKRGA